MLGEVWEKGESRQLARAACFGIVCAIVGALFSTAAWGAATMTISGAALGSSGTSAVTLNWGNVNGLGVGGTVVSGVSALGFSGVAYTSSITINLGGQGGGAGTTSSITARVAGGSNFTHNLLFAAGCTSGGSCSGSFSNISAATVTVATGVPKNGSANVTIAVFIPMANGAGNVYTGSDTATVTFTSVPSAGGAASATLAMTINVQDAVNLTLSTATGGATISAGAVSFGSGNGLGLGSPTVSGVTKFTTTSGRATTSAIYSTPYQITPSWSDFTNNSATVTYCQSSSFSALGSELTLVYSDSSPASAASFSTVTTCPTAVSVTGFSNNTAATRYLGIKVSHLNSGSGSASAGLTYTITAN